MTAQELNTYINRVLGNSIRCLLPSYWWKRLLTRIVEYVDTTATEVKENAESQIKNLTDKVEGIDVSSVEQKINNLYGFVITTGDTTSADSMVIVDGDTISIAPKTSQKVRFSNSFTLHEGYNIISIDTSLADTSKMTSMSGMFKDATDLASVDISTFDTSNVIFATDMFNGCKSLTSLPLEYFNMSNIEYADRMFYNCESLAMSRMRFLNTTNLKTVSNMFYGCSALGGIGHQFSLENLDTSHVVEMNGMFANCTNIHSLYLDSKFDTSSVLAMDGMFDGCDNLDYLSLGENFFKMPLTSVDFSTLSKWYEYPLIRSLVDESYDRATNGLPTLEIRLHSNVYAHLTDEHKATLTSKGYTVTSVG